MPTNGYASYFILGEQDTDWDTPVLTAAMKAKIYEFVSCGLKNVGPPIVPMRFTGNPSPIPQIDNFINAEGDIQMHLHADDMLVFWKHILQATDTEVDTTDFTAQEVYGNGAGAAKAFKDEEECFGDGVGGLKAIPESPFSLDSQPTNPSNLTLTLSEADSGTFTITGTDEDDEVLVEAVVFDADTTQETVGQFKTVGVTGIAYTGIEVAATMFIEANSYEFSLDTQPGATDPTSDPAKLIVTLNAADSGTIIITGTDQNDLAITETLTFDAETTQTTTKYFKTVDARGISYTLLETAATLLIMADMNVATHVITLGDNVTDGLTIEVVKGGIPSTYIGTLLNQGVVSIAETLTLAVSAMAKRGYNRAKVPAAGAVPTASSTGTDVSAYTRVSKNVFPAWTCYLKLDAVTVPIESATLTFNNNLEFPTRFTGVRTKAKPKRNTHRDISLNCVIDYDLLQTDFDARFYNGVDTVAAFYATCTPNEGPALSITFSFPRCQVNAYPDPEVSDFSQQVQSLNLRAIRTVDASASDEASVTIVSTETAIG